MDDFSIKECLFKAIEQGDATTVKFFASRVKDVNGFYENMTALMLACQLGKVDVVEVFQKIESVDTDLTDPNGKKAVDYAIAYTVETKKFGATAYMLCWMALNCWDEMGFYTDKIKPIIEDLKKVAFKKEIMHIVAFLIALEEIINESTCQLDNLRTQGVVPSDLNILKSAMGKKISEIPDFGEITKVTPNFA